MANKKQSLKKDQPAKRKYVKRSIKWIATTNTTIDPVINIIPPASNALDDLDVIYEMVKKFESLDEQSRRRAYSYFSNKYQRYESESF